MGLSDHIGSAELGGLCHATHTFAASPPAVVVVVSLAFLPSPSPSESRPRP
eukprot:CAMPEP_0206605156 /NCGR_PEP_ID=MMETSP0325_2-20121206/50210_1 /ASSEMBLY_ACC=CAM_ASM_000347 /TAXON_ID=2866 /ORGANISM="Crypthecodinium cohnii, Strain Seligo" /LENGTH=50 /DNA_ID=CAMNT_0054120571 /DNA_START=1 /DNA_END=150 /DNA_ORIENTATION=-